MSMEIIKVNFGDFWEGFNKEDNYFTKILRRKYLVEIADDPDFYFFTHPCNGNRDYLKYNCHRIFLGWENERADWNICDYVLDSDFVPGNLHHKRYPIWAAWNMEALTKEKKLSEFSLDKKFCCMIVSNPHAKERIDFFHKLSRYKKVDSAGRHLNNIGYNIENKMDFIKDYKFVISFENSAYPGYTTEKLIEPMFANSIPIYWGNPVVNIDFNTKSFVNVNDFASYDDAVNYIIALDKNDERYAAMCMQPWFNNNQIPAEMQNESLLQFFEYILKDSKTKKPVALSRYKKYAHKAGLLVSKIKWVARQKLGLQKGFR